MIMVDYLNKIHIGYLVTVKRICMVVPYWHYGVYIGDGIVVHLSPTGLNSAAKSEAKVHRVTLKDFVGDDYEQLGYVPLPSDVHPDHVVERATRAEDKPFRDKKYNLLFNNCENFARWCQSGIAESTQIDVAILEFLIFIILVMLIIISNVIHNIRNIHVEK